MVEYKKEWYKFLEKTTIQSAKEIVPLILDIVHPKSVIDIGCGNGTWLSIFRELGVNDIFGIDGIWVDKETLIIPAEKFMRLNLEQPVSLNRQFDLVMSLEVAEHLSKKHANSFVDSLINLGPLILFSAAIPFQGGEHHQNEQWPDYWVKIFQEKGYVLIDHLRKRIWQNPRVHFIYSQNLLFFCRKEALNKFPLLLEEFQKNPNPSQLNLVHPRLYLGMIPSKDPRILLSNMSNKTILTYLPRIMINRIVYKIYEALMRIKKKIFHS